MCAAGTGADAEADRKIASSSQPGAPRRHGSNERGSFNVISSSAALTSTSPGQLQLHRKPKTAAPLGFRARLEGQIADAKCVDLLKTLPSSTGTSKRGFVKAKPRGAVPQVLQLNRRMTIDELKEWYKSAARLDKEEREWAISIPGLTRLRRLGKGGFGEIWDVHEESSGRFYALKHITTGTVLSPYASDITVAHHQIAHSNSAISEIRVGISLFPHVRLDVDANTLQLVTPVAKHKSMVIKQQLETDQARDSSLVHQDNSDHNHDASSNPRFTKLFRVFQENRDFWLLYERGGRTLHELVFAIHGEFHKGSRVYRLEHRELYQQMRADPAIVQSLLKHLLEAVKILSEHQVVHADIKPDNILLQWRQYQHEPSLRAADLCVQLIDFGSSFSIERNRYPPATQSSSKNGGHGGGGGTPEYVPPEALAPSAPPPPPQRPQSSSSLRFTPNTTTSCESLSIQTTGSHSSSFDMWSVGAVLLELLCGFPLWFGYRSRIEFEGKEHWVKNGGLFTAKHRDPASIQQRQLQVVGDIERSLQSFSAGMLHNWPKQTADLALDLLRQLLEPSPKTRVTPEAALSHPFLR